MGALHWALRELIVGFWETCSEGAAWLFDVFTPRVMMHLAWILFVGGTFCVNAALRIPSCCQRSPRSEAMSNLRALYTAQMAYRAEMDYFHDDFARIGFSPELNNRYTYFGAPSGPHAQGTRMGREISGAPYVIVPGDPAKAARVFHDFYETRCPLTVGRGTDGEVGALGLSSMGFLGAAAGVIDGKLDWWSVATFERTSPSGELIRAGVPFNELFEVRVN